MLSAYRKRASAYRSQLDGDALVESRLSPKQHAQIQQALVEHGFLNGTTDGEFGPNTRAAIKSFQSQSDSEATGVLTANQRQQLLGGKPRDETMSAEGELSDKASRLSSTQAASLCQSSDPELRLIGCTAIINVRGRGSSVTYSDALDGRCWAFNDLGQYARGLPDCRAASQQAPRRPYAYNNLGRSFLGLGDVPHAITAFTKSIELKSDFVHAYLGRAKAYAQSNKVELAKQDYETVLGIDPANAEAQEGLKGSAPGTLGEDRSLPEVPPGVSDTAKLGEARVFLEDAQKFIAEQTTVPSISEIAKEAARLQIALNGFDEAATKQSMQRLQPLLKSIPGFDEFEQQRQAARQRQEAQRLSEAKLLGDMDIFFVDEFMKTHLGDTKTASLIALKERIKKALKTDSIAETTNANDSFRSYVEENGLREPFDVISKNFSGPTAAPADNTKPPAERFGLTDKSRYIVEGPREDIVLLYNISPTAPNVWRNVRGDVVFQNDAATVCFAQVTPDVTIARYVEHLLRDKGAQSVTSMSAPCDLSLASKAIDIVAFQRGELLKQREDYVFALTKKVEDDIFREYQIVTDYPTMFEKRQVLALEIERDIEKNERQGYGVLALYNSSVACVIAGGSLDITDGLKELLS